MAAAHLLGPEIAEAPASAFVPGCTGKLPMTLRQARAVVMRRGRGTFYRCMACQCVHVTSARQAPAPFPRWAATAVAALTCNKSETAIHER